MITIQRQDTEFSGGTSPAYAQPTEAPVISDAPAEPKMSTISPNGTGGLDYKFVAPKTTPVQRYIAPSDDIKDIYQGYADTIALNTRLSELVAGNAPTSVSDEAKNETVRNNMMAAAEYQPEQQARVNQTANVLGLDKETVEADVGSAELAALRVGMKLDRINEWHPAVREWMVDPYNARVGRRDVTNLNAFASIIDGFGSGLTKLGGIETRMNELDAKRANEVPLTPAEEQEYLRLETERSLIPEGENALFNFSQAAGAFTSGGAAQIGMAAARGAPVFAAGVGAGALGGFISTPGPVQARAAGAVIGAARALPTALSAASRTGAFDVGAEQTMGQAYREFKKIKSVDGTPIDPQAARIAAKIAGAAGGFLSIGAAEVVSGAVGRNLSKGFTKTVLQKALETSPTFQKALLAWSKNYATTVASQGALMAAFELNNIVGEELAKTFDDKKLFADTTPLEALSRIGQAGAVGALTSAGPLLVLSGASNVRQLGQIAKYERDRARLESLNSAADATTVTGRDRQTFAQKAVEQAALPKAQKNVFIDSEAFIKYFAGKNEQLTETVEKLGISEQLKNGQTLSIPLENYLSFLSADARKALIEETSLTAGGLTGAEAKSIYTRIAAEQGNVTKRAQEKFDSLTAQQKSRILVEQGVEADLVKLKSKKATAKAQSKLYGAFFSTLAELSGEDAFALYQKYKPTITRAFDSSLLTERTTDRGNFDPAGNVITLFSAADPTTFLHESGHAFLQIVDQIGSTENASPEVKALREAALKYVGAEGGKPFTEAQQEKWAAAFEQFLADGVAPNKALKPAFRQYGRWLGALYDQHVRSGGQQTGEVAGIFGRLLGASEVLNANEDAAPMAPLFKTPEEAGMSAKGYAEYINTHNRALETAQDTLFQKAQARVEKAKISEYRKIRAEEKAKAEKEVGNMRWALVRSFLSTGKFEYVSEKTGERIEVGEQLKVGLNRQELEQMVADGVITQKQLDELNPRWVKKDGVPLEDVAQLFEYDNKYKMVEELTANVSKEEMVQGFVEQAMMEKYADFLAESNIEAAARDALVNDPKFATLRKEIDALDKLSGRTGTPLDILAEIVSQRMDEAVYGTLSPEQYFRDARKAAEQAQSYFASGRYAQAAEARRKQAEFYLSYKEATSRLKQVDRFVEKLKDYATNPSARAKIGLGDPEYLARIDEILSLVSLSNESEASRAVKIGTLAEWQRRQNEDYNFPIIPESLAEVRTKLNINDAKLGLIEDVYNAVESIAHVGRQLKELNDITVASARQTKAQEIVESLRVNNKQRTEPKAVSSSNKLYDAARYGERIATTLRLVEFLLTEFDGDKVGPLTKFIFQPIAKAVNKATLELTETMGELNKILSDYGSGELARDVYIKELGTKIAKRDVLYWALQTGNEGNKAALYGRYSAAEVAGVLATMTKKDWDTVKRIGNLLEKDKERIQAHNQRVTGLKLKMVQPTKVSTPFGEYEGWYFPLAYEMKNGTVEQNLKDSGIVAMNQFTGAIATQYGYRMARVGTGDRVIRLRGWDPLDSHFKQVYTDLNLFEPVRDVARLLKDKNVRSALESTMGAEKANYLNWWLKESIGTNVTGSFITDGMARFIRKRTTFAQLGLKVGSAVVNIVGYANTVDELGAKWATLGLAKAYANPAKIGELHSWVESVSDFMKTRRRNVDRNIAEINNKYDAGKVKSAYEDSAFAMIGFFDAATALPSWLGGYSKALEEMRMSHEDAVQYADSVVRKTQGAGLSYAQSQLIAGGNDTARLFTMFQTYTNVVYNRLLRRMNNVKRDGIVALPAALAGVANMMIAPALMEQIIKRNFPDVDDDEKWKKIAQIVALQGTGLIPIAGGVFRAMLTGQDYQMTPVESLIRAGQLVIKDTERENFDKNTLKAGVTLASLLAPVPASQLSVTIDAMANQANGEDVSFLDYFIRPPRE